LAIENQWVKKFSYYGGNIIAAYIWLCGEKNAALAAANNAFAVSFF